MTIHPDEHDHDTIRGAAGDDASRRAQAFDAAARAAHTDALLHVSARVQAQLQQRRRAVLAGEARAARTPWQRTGPLLALGGTAAIALAIGLRFAGEHTGKPGGGAPVNDVPRVATQNDGTSATGIASPGAANTSDTTSDNTSNTATAMTTGNAARPASNTTKDEAASASDTSMREIDALLAVAVGDAAGANDIGGGEATNDAPMLAANDDLLLAGLDENPDLYLWLGSDESPADAVELL
jgi:hypothetical protein